MIGNWQLEYEFNGILSFSNFDLESYLNGKRIEDIFTFIYDIRQIQTIFQYINNVPEPDLTHHSHPYEYVKSGG